MNMLIGCLVEVVSAVAATEKEASRVSYVMSKVQSIVCELDEDKDNMISRDEFAKILENPGACQALQDVGVDVLGLVDCAETVFVDAQGETVEQLDFNDFMEVVLRMRGTNQASVKDVVELRKLIRTGQLSMKVRLDALEARQKDS